MAIRTGVEIGESLKCYGYVYMWCDVKRNMYYIGSHKGRVYDKYKSGSKWLNKVIKKRPDTMKMRVLEYYYGRDREELYRLEGKWLQFYEVEKYPNRYYNFKNTARGGMGPFKHKGKKRADYTPGWIDHRKGKKLEEIYKDPETVRERLKNTQTRHFEKYGCGITKGKKHKSDKRTGKTVEEIYGYRRVVNPPKPFIITIQKPNCSKYIIPCKHEEDFYTLVKMESKTLQTLKKHGKKVIWRRLPSTKHDFPINTLLWFEYL